MLCAVKFSPTCAIADRYPTGAWFFIWTIVNILSTSLGGLDLLASAVLVLDTDGRIVYANAGAESLLESSLKVLQKHCPQR